MKRSADATFASKHAELWIGDIFCPLPPPPGGCRLAAARAVARADAPVSRQTIVPGFEVDTIEPNESVECAYPKEAVGRLRTCCALSLLNASDGSLWIGTGAGLVRLKDDKMSALTSGDGRYNSIIEDGKGRIWAARTRIRDNKGPLCEVEGGRVECHGENDGLGCRFGNVVGKDKSGTVFVGDQGQVCSWKDGAAATYPAPPADAGCKPSIGSLLADLDDAMLVGCEGGLRRLERGRLVAFQTASLDANKLRGAKLLYDRDGGLWDRNH